MPVITASQSVRRHPPRGWRAHLTRIALGTAAVFFLLTLSAGALHHHGSSSSLQRIDCQACAWVHSAAGALGHAAPALAALCAKLAPQTPATGLPATFTASPHHGRAPPFSLV